MVTRDWESLRVSWQTWIVVLVGTCVQQVAYVLAYRFAPPVEIDILVYLWPAFAILLSLLLLGKKLSTKNGLSLMLGLLAVVFLSLNKLSQSSFHFNIGHIFALVCAFLWGLYTVLIRKVSPINMNIIGISYGVGAFFSLTLHLKYEAFILPNLSQVLILLYYGIFISFIAFCLWSKAIQKGKAVLLTLSSYFKPVVSLLLLCLFKLASFNLELGLACGMVLLSGLLNASVDWYEARVWFASFFMRRFVLFR